VLSAIALEISIPEEAVGSVMASDRIFPDNARATRKYLIAFIFFFGKDTPTDFGMKWKTSGGEELPFSFQVLVGGFSR